MSGLLQISEPGLSSAPHEERLAVGIDLGTTNSLVASVISGVPEVIVDEADRPMLPSVVRFSEEGIVQTGFEALGHQVEDAPNTVSSVKRLIGRALADIDMGQTLPYALSEMGGVIRIATRAGEKTPVEVSAEILKSLKRRAKARLGGELVGAVITVPAYFDDAQRQATKDAARLAGLEVLRLLNEPTAAALAYGLDSGAEGLYLVYDLGGGTFDVSLLRLAKGVFEVVATGGDSALGGDDFDRVLASFALKARCTLDCLSAREKREALVLARGCREELTEKLVTQFHLRLDSGEVLEKTISREDFEEACAGLVTRTMDVLQGVLADAAVQPDAVQGVVLVGGSTRMPCVRHSVQLAFGRAPLTDIDPDKVVAIGAALQADKLAGNSRSDDWLLLDVTPLSLGIEMMGGLVEKIIPRNTPVPVAMAQDFTTFKDNQTALAVHVVQGEREIVDKCRSLARFELRGIPPMAAGNARIRITYRIDADGILSVSARETRTGVESAIRVKPSYGLADEEIVRMLREGNEAAQSDLEERKLREERVEAERVLIATRSALQTDGDLLDAAQREAIEETMLSLVKAAGGCDAEQIKAQSAALVKATSEFAARRMDRSIRLALAGQSLQSIENRKE